MNAQRDGLAVQSVEGPTGPETRNVKVEKEEPLVEQARLGNSLHLAHWCLASVHATTQAICLSAVFVGPCLSTCLLIIGRIQWFSET